MHSSQDASDIGADRETVGQLAHIRGFVGYQFILFIQMMTSTMTIVRIFEAYKKLTGNAQRFVEFGAKMAAIEKMEAESEGQQLLLGKSHDHRWHLGCILSRVSAISCGQATRSSSPTR